MTLRLLTLTLLIFSSFFVFAKDPVDSTEIYLKVFEHYKDSVNKTLSYQTGKINPDGGKLVLNVPDGFKYLNKEQSKMVITKIWGNPESSAEEVVGMMFPKDSDPFADSNYAFVITYSEIGYVKDEDADKINYDDMLKNLQESEKEENKERVKAGFPAVHIVGWAQKPFYDSKRKILHWAKELKFGEDEGANTLNYQIRILGRKGMVSLNAVGKMYDLPLVNRDIDKVLGVASFTEGNSYFDFNPKVDNVAAWTIGGLVAGKILAKVGFFAVIAKFLAPLWKFIVLFFVGIGAWIKRKLGLKKDAPPVDTLPEETTPAEGEAAHTDGEAVTPHIDGDVPHTGSETGHTNGEAAHAEAVTPHTDGDLPHEGTVTPHTDGEVPHSGSEAAHGGSETPHAGGETGHTGSETPHGNGDEPKPLA